MSPGDSLIDSITTGIESSKKGIIVLSTNFLENKGWGEYELKSIITRQIATSTKVIVPIWHNIESRDINNLWLRDIVALNSRNSLTDIVNELTKIL